MRTLVVHTGGIGDLLLACPALGRLAASGPIEMAGQVRRLELAQMAGIAQRVWSLDSIDFSSVFCDPSSRLSAFAKRFDLAVIWMRDDGRIADALRFCGIPRVRCFPGLPPADWARHASEYYLECLEFHHAAAVRVAVKAEPICPIIIHPGSGGSHKNWPIGHFMTVEEALVESGRRVGWCLGPAEEGVILRPGSRTVNRETLADLAGVLGGARLYIGNDSGITHLAAAVGCPTVAVFGPTAPAVWAPCGSHVRVVHGAPWPSPEAVLGAARDLLECGRTW